MQTSELPKCNCLACGIDLDAATAVKDDALPKSGDITICLQCGHLMAFSDQLTVRELTPNEQIEIAGDPIILKVQEARAHVMKKHA